MEDAYQIFLITGGDKLPRVHEARFCLMGVRGKYLQRGPVSGFCLSGGGGGGGGGGGVGGGR